MNTLAVRRVLAPPRWPPVVVLRGLVAPGTMLRNLWPSIDLDALLFGSVDLDLAPLLDPIPALAPASSQPLCIAPPTTGRNAQWLDDSDDSDDVDEVDAEAAPRRVRAVPDGPAPARTLDQSRIDGRGIGRRLPASQRTGGQSGGHGTSNDPTFGGVLERRVVAALEAWSAGEVRQPVAPQTRRTASHQAGLTAPRTRAGRPRTDHPMSAPTTRPATDASLTGPQRPASPPTTNGWGTLVERVIESATAATTTSVEVRTTSVIEQVTTALTRVEERLTILASATHRERVTASETATDTEVIRWLDDEDLTGRLQAILRRQARRHGIDLSR